VFQVSTLEDWSVIAYGYMDSEYKQSSLFFVAVIIFANFFVINMTFR
jgi:Ion transport protein